MLLPPARLRGAQQRHDAALRACARAMLRVLLRWLLFFAADD